MKRLLFAFALLFASVSAFADDRLRVTSLEEWLTYYYLDPKPAEVAAALRQVSEQGLFEDDGAQAALSGFFAEIFTAHPKRIESWVAPYVGISKRHILYSALWSADSPESKAALEQMARALSPDEARQLSLLIATAPPTVESMDIDGPAALDYLWGRFMASGSETAVNRVIDQVKLVNTRGNVKLMLIGGAAQWSVAANARQHKRVLAIVKARAESADPETKEILLKIVADGEREKLPQAR